MSEPYASDASLENNHIYGSDEEKEVRDVLNIKKKEKKRSIFDEVNKGMLM